jgi:phosphatidate cytidylyltransferase
MGGDYLKWGTFGVILIALYEFYQSTDTMGIFTIGGGYLTAIFLYVNGFAYFEIFLTVLMFIFMVTGLRSNKIDMQRLGIFMVSIFYIVIPVYMMNLIATSAYPKVLWLLLLVAWISDTCAYFAGRTFGKKPLAPRISPKKTVEGSIGGITGATLAAIIFYFTFNCSEMIDLPMYLVVVVIAAVFSQLGDLVASSIKRAFSIKDFGKIMPGHGGLLDRFDSVIILLPYFYLLTFII